MPQQGWGEKEKRMATAAEEVDTRFNMNISVGKEGFPELAH